jgi:type II secretory pathway pseudopilin PulG
MNGDKGFTYPAALLLIIIVSVSLMVVQKQWSTIVKREKEKELFFRAGKIIDGIESFYQNSSTGSPQYPRSLKVLLKDNRSLGLKRYLRKIYKDPLTQAGNWGLVYDGKGGIKGVFSQSKKEPLKKGNFSKKYKSFENKKKYSDWKFVYEPKKETAS